MKCTIDKHDKTTCLDSLVLLAWMIMECTGGSIPIIAHEKRLVSCIKIVYHAISLFLQNINSP